MKVFEKRVIANSVVLVSVTVVKQRTGTEPIVEISSIYVETVINKRVGSIGAILCAGAVEQKGRSAGGGIRIRSVEHQRSPAKPGIVAAGSRFKERIPTNRCVSSAGGQVLKCFSAFRGCEPVIAQIGRASCRERV